MATKEEDIKREVVPEFIEYDGSHHRLNSIDKELWKRIVELESRVKQLERK